MGSNKQNILVICGPTASGKTGLALQLAKELPKANLLSVDSRQIYQDLDIVTGKDIPDNLPSTIKIFGHDIFASDEIANLADFVRYSQKVIKASQDNNTPLIIVGGTGLYLKAITQNMSDILIPPNPELRSELEKLSLSALQDLLRQENPSKFSSLNRSDLMNPRRLVRAIEITRSQPQKTTIDVTSNNVSFRWIGLMPDKDTIKTLIRQRVLERIKDGAIEEVKELLDKYSDRKLPIFTSLGVSQIIDFLETNITKDELIEVWTRAEVDYARRQIVWFKKQSNIVWYDKSTDKNLLISELKKTYQ